MKTEADYGREGNLEKAQALPLRCLCDPRRRLVPRKEEEEGRRRRGRRADGVQVVVVLT